MQVVEFLHANSLKTSSLRDPGYSLDGISLEGLMVTMCHVGGFKSPPHYRNVGSSLFHPDLHWIWLKCVRGRKDVQCTWIPTNSNLRLGRVLQPHVGQTLLTTPFQPSSSNITFKRSYVVKWDYQNIIYILMLSFGFLPTRSSVYFHHSHPARELHSYSSVSLFVSPWTIIPKI